jgi:O-antigen ligase
MRPSADMGKLGFLLGLYLFMHTAPVAELLDVYAHINVSEVLITGAILAVGVVFTGRLDRFLEVPLARWWIALGVFLLLASVFGIYRRQSITFTLAYLIRFHSMPFLICAIATTIAHVRKIILWPGIASWCLIGICIFFGRYTESRFQIPGTTLENPNDLSFLLLFSSSYALLLLFSRSILVRLLWVGTLPLMLYFVLRTGSRANFFTFLVALGVVLLIVPGKIKIALATFALMGALALSLFIPAATWDRLTMVSANAEQDLLYNPQLSSELGSQIARVELQKRAYQLALENPLFGVGPLMFAQGADEMVRRETGHKTAWQDAHNVYLQIAAEDGIPAALLYILSFVMCWKMNYSSYKASFHDARLREARAQSFCLALGTVIYAVGTLFCNFAYEAFWPVMVGLSAANYLAVRSAGAALPTPLRQTSQPVPVIAS